MKRSPVRAESEMVLMTRPCRSITSGRAARVTLIVPTSVTPTTRSTSSAVVSLNSLTTQVAALLTRIEIGPSSECSRAMAVSMEEGSPMSIWRGIAWPPALQMASATRVADSPDRSATATRAPARASVFAIASPMPLPAPVTRATSPARSTAMLIESLSEIGDAWRSPVLASRQMRPRLLWLHRSPGRH